MAPRYQGTRSTTARLHRPVAGDHAGDHAWRRLGSATDAGDQVGVLCGASRDCRRLVVLGDAFAEVGGVAEAAAIGHNGDHELAKHVTRAAAVTSRTTGDQTLSAARSPGPIYLARAMAFAVGSATKPRQQLPAPVIYVRGDNGQLRGGVSIPRHVAAIG